MNVPTWVCLQYHCPQTSEINFLHCCHQLFLPQCKFHGQLQRRPILSFNNVSGRCTWQPCCPSYLILLASWHYDDVPYGVPDYIIVTYHTMYHISYCAPQQYDFAFRIKNWSVELTQDELMTQLDKWSVRLFGEYHSEWLKYLLYGKYHSKCLNSWLYGGYFIKCVSTIWFMVGII